MDMNPEQDPARSMVDESLQIKLTRMRDRLSEMGRVAVAFSGGVDSTFVLKIAADTLGATHVLAVTGVSDSLPRRELHQAQSLAHRLKVRLHLVEPGELENPDYLANPVNRCYHCKVALYERIGAILREYRLDTAVNGTNVDDLSDYRPGLAAAEEYGIRSPCVEAGLGKADIRSLSKAFDLPTHDKPAAPCLSSRVPYGEAITPQKLHMIEQAENFLHDLGFRECRVRHHGRLARIEVPTEAIGSLIAPNMRPKIDAAFREFGYQYVTVDLRGFHSGRMNEVIAFGRRQRVR